MYDVTNDTRIDAFNNFEVDVDHLSILKRLNYFMKPFKLHNFDIKIEIETMFLSYFLVQSCVNWCINQPSMSYQQVNLLTIQLINEWMNIIPIQSNLSIHQPLTQEPISPSHHPSIHPPMHPSIHPMTIYIP